MKREQIERDFRIDYKNNHRQSHSIKWERIKFRKLLEQVTMDKIGCAKEEIKDYQGIELRKSEHRTGKSTCFRYYFKNILLGFETMSSVSYSYGLNDLKNTIDNIHSIEKKCLDELDKLQSRINWKINQAW